MNTRNEVHPAFAGLIGAAQADITPPAGIFNRNWGAATSDVSTGIHRPLTATALALRADAASQPLVLLSLDLGWWRTVEDEWALRGAVIEALGVDISRVVVNLIHTHAGPGICAEDEDKPGGRLIPAYLTHLRETCIRIAQQAVANAAPGRLEWAYGRCDLARNRDLPDPAADRIVCGFNPDAPADDTLLIGRATTATGAPIATLINYACHPVTLAWQNALISPDFVGAMRELVEATTGVPCLFLQGASGELAPRQQYTGDTAIADANGRVLGYAALSVLANMLPPGHALAYDGVVESGAPLATWRREATDASSALSSEVVQVTLMLKALPAIADVQAQLTAATDNFQRERLRRKLRLLRAVGDGPTHTTPVWIWRIGPAVLVAQPNEAYSDFQIALRAAFPGTAIAVLNISNGGYAYLTPRAMYARDQYQVWQSPYAEGCLETTTETVLAALNR